MRGQRRRRLLHSMRANVAALLVLVIAGLVGYSLLRADLLKNAQSTGTALAGSYAAEEYSSLVVYETLLDFGAESIDAWYGQGWTHEEVQDWLAAYLQRLQALLGDASVDPYAVLDGRIVAANPWEGDEGFDTGQAAWYQQAVQARGEVIFTDVYTDVITGQPVITIARQCGRSGAVLAFDIFPENFQFQYSTLTLPEGGSFFLCDASGTRLHQQTQLASSSEEALRQYVADLAGQVRSGALDRYDAAITDLEGARRNVYSSILPNGWLAILTVPYETILQELCGFTGVCSAMLLICLAAVALLGWRDLRLNRRAARTNETVRVLGNSYYALYRVDYEHDAYEMIKGSDYVRSRVGPAGRYEDLLQVMGEVIEPDAVDDYKRSFSLENIRRLVDRRMRDFGGDFRRRFGAVYRWVSVRVLFDESLAPGEVVLCFREVEEEKQQRLEERKLLEQSLEAARKSERAKQAFFSNMSHDMRTPLNAIQGLTELARQQLDDRDKLAGYLDKIGYSSRQLLELVNDILDMSRMEQGKVVLDNQQFNLTECISLCAEAFRPQAEAEGKTLEVSLQVKQATVLGDSFRISQIMNNLLSNAFKFTAHGDRVSVRLTQFERDEHAKYQIVVQDTGAGMSQDFLPQLFEPYARETRFGVRQVSGTGLGMPIVKNLVTQMSGQIQVESAPDQGTTFTIVIPFTAVDDPLPGREVAPEQGAFSLSGRRILLAEDNMVNMEIATEILTMNGVEVIQAWNGQEAVECFRSSAPFHFDAILMDMQMPVMDGCEAARRIRAMARPDAGRVPILAVTANAFAEDLAATSAAGMDAHISKPIDFNILCQTLEKLIGQGHAQAPGRPSSG